MYFGEIRGLNRSEEFGVGRKSEEIGEWKQESSKKSEGLERIGQDWKMWNKVGEAGEGQWG